MATIRSSESCLAELAQHLVARDLLGRPVHRVVFHRHVEALDLRSGDVPGLDKGVGERVMVALFVLIAQVLAHQLDLVHRGQLALDHLACEQRIVFSGHAGSCLPVAGMARPRLALLLKVTL
jgi:hypothetical protein